MPVIYVIRPSDVYQPELSAWLREAIATLSGDKEWIDWTVRVLTANEKNSFEFLDFYSIIAETMGPVLVLGSLQHAPVSKLQSKLLLRCTVVHVENIAESTDIYGALLRCLVCHADGDPQVPVRLAAAVQILRKLMKHDYWGGEAKNKAFIWADDLPNGGMSAAVLPVVRAVSLELLNRGVLKSKRSNGKLKLALNADRIEDINQILNLEIKDASLMKWFLGVKGMVSARELDGVADISAK